MRTTRHRREVLTLALSRGTRIPGALSFPPGYVVDFFQIVKDRIGMYCVLCKRPSYDAQTWTCSQSSVASASKTPRKSAPYPIFFLP